MADSNTYVCKIVTIGDSHVGKTMILERYVTGLFGTSHTATIGVDFKEKTINLDGKTVIFKIWDTAGQERYRTFTKSYYTSTNAILFVYDITSDKTFQSIKDWVKEVNNNTDTSKMIILLIGNKTDLKDKRAISEEDGQKLADSLGYIHYETSALSNTNIDEVFTYIGKEIIKRGIGCKANSTNNNIKLDHAKSAQPGGKKGCCKN